MGRALRSRSLAIAILAIGASACGPPKSVDATEVVKNIGAYAGKRVVVRAKWKSGARCRTEKTVEDKWQTYCNDCQFCRGPIVLDVDMPLPEEGLDDWPLILGGTYEGKDIRCKGPLNAVECWPFQEGKTYVVQGQIEAQRPPKLLVERFWEVD